MNNLELMPLERIHQIVDAFPDDLRDEIFQLVEEQTEGYTALEMSAFITAIAVCGVVAEKSTTVDAIRFYNLGTLCALSLKIHTMKEEGRADE